MTTAGRQRLKRPIRFDPQEGVDRKDIKVLCARYRALAEVRLARTRALLSARQAQVLDLLPLLFQVNHPLLPGYIGRTTPSGITGYEPGPAEIQAAQRLCRSFTYRSDKRAQTDIQSLFLMGSTGSIAHGGSSDFDVWLCHRSGLEAGARRELSRKAEKVCAWALEQGVEMHIFLIDPAEYRQLRKQAEADQEDCGTAQHFLLLDEFYRTHLWLAGAYPLWWIIPPEQESRFNECARALVQKRFIRARDYIDFGGCPRIPPGEFVGAGMWQLYKGVDAPYKSVLKLMLIETYAADPEAGPNLSLSFKQAIFDDEVEPDDLDPYVMIYRRLEASLLRRQQPERLSLARKSFYLKVGERLSITVADREGNWRRRMMEALVRDWGWTAEDLRYLDQRGRWKVDEVVVERRAVVAELTGCYRFLSAYAREQRLASSISARDLHLLGRKLYAAFQRKAGKLELINPGIAPDLGEDSLALHHTSAYPDGGGGSGWVMYRNLPQGSEPPFPSPVRRATGLFELLAWAHVNQLLVTGTTLSLAAGQTSTRLFELQQLVQVLQQVLPLPMPPVSQADYQARAQVREVILAINVGVDPMQELSQRGLSKLSDQTDALGYATERTNLVAQVDLLVRNSWNEVLVQHYETGDTLIQALKTWLALLAEAEQSGAGLVPPEVCCFCPTRAPSIASRVQELVRQILHTYFSHPTLPASRYLLQMDERFFVLQFVNRQPRFTALANREALQDFLEQPQTEDSSLVLDSHALPGDVLQAIVAVQRPGALQVFARLHEGQLDLQVRDERGSLWFQRQPCPDSDEALEVLRGLHRFLVAVHDRRQMHDGLLADGDGVAEIEYYQVQNTRSGYKAERLRGVDRLRPLHWPEIQVIGERVIDNRLQYRLVIGTQEVPADPDEAIQLDRAVAVLQERFRPGARLQAVITDLSLPGGWVDEDLYTRRQTLHYLRFRRHIEQGLAAAMARHRPLAG